MERDTWRQNLTKNRMTKGRPEERLSKEERPLKEDAWRNRSVNSRPEDDLSTGDLSIEERRERHRWKLLSERLYKPMGWLIIGIVLLLNVAGMILPDRTFSEEENRVLAELPKLNGESIVNQDYMKGLESYTSDQFVLRDMWIRLKVQCDLLMGKREFNGVYLGKKKYLMQIPAEPDEKNVQENLDAINQFAARNSNQHISAMIVPNAAYVMQEDLPKGAPVRDQGKDMEKIKRQLAGRVECIDVTQTLQQHADETIYYKTDHHWTSKGAAYAFNAAAGQLKIEGAVTDYHIYTVTADFSGTLASRSGYHKTEDKIEVYEPEYVDFQYLVSDSDHEEKRPTVYDKSALDGKDKYQVFFGGNHATVDIETTIDTKRRLLVFKDSYANCFVPFLLPYYNEVIMVDPRYYYDNVQNLIDNKRITDVLFLYNMDTFLNDNSLADVLTGE